MKMVGERNAGIGNPELRVLIMPISERNRYIYVDNLKEVVEGDDNLERVVIRNYIRGEDLARICPEVAEKVREYSQNYPVDFPKSRISKTDRAKYGGAVALQFMPEKVPILGKFAEASKEWLAVGGAVIGGTLGYATGSGDGSEIINALIGGGIGYVIGYISPLLYGVSGFARKGYSAHKKNVENESLSERNARIRGNIERIADRIYYQEINIHRRILPDFGMDFINQYVWGRWADPNTVIQPEHEWVCRGFEKALSDENSARILRQAENYNLNRYYKTKVRDFRRWQMNH